MVTIHGVILYRYGIGMIYYKQEKFALAEVHFRKALSINPQSPVLLCHIGVVSQHCHLTCRVLYCAVIISIVNWLTEACASLSYWSGKSALSFNLQSPVLCCHYQHCQLTHWGLERVDILHRIFSNAFLAKICVLWLRCQWCSSKRQYINIGSG